MGKTEVGSSVAEAVYSEGSMPLVCVCWGMSVSSVRGALMNDFSSRAAKKTPTDLLGCLASVSGYAPGFGLYYFKAFVW